MQRAEPRQNESARLYLAIAIAALTVLGLALLLLRPASPVDPGRTPLPTRLPANVDEPARR
jgi:hypothetical protein